MRVVASQILRIDIKVHLAICNIPALLLSSTRFHYLNMTTGRKIADYVMTQLIGQGAFARVFQGYRQGYDQKYAIKVISIFMENTKTAIDPTDKEIEILKKIQHPNIVKLIDVKKSKNNCYLILEYCERGDLEKYMHKYFRKGMPEKTAQKLLLQISDAVRTLHEHNIVHRDIKLANILINTQCVAKLSDFGFAKTQDVASYMKTYCGSPITMAPEIHEHEKYDLKCDVWSMGVITYQLIYGHAPFLPSNNGGVKDLAEVIKRAEVTFPEHPQMPESFKQLIYGCLQKDPNKRISIHEFCNSEWIQQGKVNQQSVSEDLRLLAGQEAEEELVEPGSPLINKQVGELEKSIAGRVYSVIKDHLQEQSRLLNRISDEIDKSPYRNDDMIKLKNFLLFSFCQTVKHTPVVVEQGKDSFSFKISDIPTLSAILPNFEEFQHVEPLKSLILNIDRVASEEKKMGKQAAIQTYKLIMRIFPLFPRNQLELAIIVAPNYNISFKFKDVSVALTTCNLSENETNFLETQLRLKSLNEDFQQTIKGLRNLCESRIREIEQQLR